MRAGRRRGGGKRPPHVRARATALRAGDANLVSVALRTRTNVANGEYLGGREAAEALAVWLHVELKLDLKSKTHSFKSFMPTGAVLPYLLGRLLASAAPRCRVWRRSDCPHRVLGEYPLRQRDERHGWIVIR